MVNWAVVRFFQVSLGIGLDIVTEYRLKPLKLKLSSICWLQTEILFEHFHSLSVSEL
jgi:hypothetical protein